MHLCLLITGFAFLIINLELNYGKWKHRIKLIKFEKDQMLGSKWAILKSAMFLVVGHLP